MGTKRHQLQLVLRISSLFSQYNIKGGAELKAYFSEIGAETKAYFGPEIGFRFGPTPYYVISFFTQYIALRFRETGRVTRHYISTT